MELAIVLWHVDVNYSERMGLLILMLTLTPIILKFLWYLNCSALFEHYLYFWFTSLFHFQAVFQPAVADTLSVISYSPSTSFLPFIADTSTPLKSIP